MGARSRRPPEGVRDLAGADEFFADLVRGHQRLRPIWIPRCQQYLDHLVQQGPQRPSARGRATREPSADERLAVLDQSTAVGGIDVTVAGEARAHAALRVDKNRLDHLGGQVPFPAQRPPRGLTCLVERRSSTTGGAAGLAATPIIKESARVRAGIGS